MPQDPLTFHARESRRQRRCHIIGRIARALAGIVSLLWLFSEIAPFNTSIPRVLVNVGRGYILLLVPRAESILPTQFEWQPKGPDRLTVLRLGDTRSLLTS